MHSLHVIMNQPGEFASKLDMVLAHFLKIVQEVGLEKITSQPLANAFSRGVNLVRSGRAVAQRPLVGVEVDAVLHIRVERLHLHVPKQWHHLAKHTWLCGDIHPLKFHLKIKEDLVKF